MTERTTPAHLVPRALLLESEDLLAAPHAAQQVQAHDLTYTDYLKYLTDDLASGLDRAAWARRLAKEGDIALARRLAISCTSPDLDRYVESQRSAWLIQCQDRQERSQQALDKSPMPLSPDDAQRIARLREEASAHILAEHYHLAQRILRQLSGELREMLQYAAQRQQERRDQAIKRLSIAREHYYALVRSYDTSKISEHINKLLYMAERLALHSPLSDTDLQSLDRCCAAVGQLCDDPTVASSATVALISALAAPPVKPSETLQPPQTNTAPDSDHLPQPPETPDGWTPEADAYLIDHYLSQPDEDLARRLAVPVEAIRARIETLRLVGARQADVRAPRGRELRQVFWANPYIPGQPITTLKMFYGRERDLEYLRSNLSHSADEEQGRVVILEGHRRTGKTSLLRHLEGKKSIPSILAPRIPIYLPIDSYIPFTSATLFYKMSYSIYKTLHHHDYPLAQPRLADFQADFAQTWHNYLEAAQEAIGGAGARATNGSESAGTRFSQAPAAKGAGLVLMFDEFQIIEERRAAGVLDKDVYWVLRADIQEARHIDFILAGTMRLEDIVRQHEAALFGIGPTHILRSLDDQNARRLIREPVRDQNVNYDDDAVDLIIALSSSYPYYVQLLCSVLFNYLNDRQKQRATRADIERVLPVVLEEGSTQFASILFANDVSSLERYALAGAAELITTLGGSCHRKALFALLRDKKLVSGETEFEQAIRQLTLRDLMKDGGGGEHIAFQVDLFRQWMRDQKRLDRVAREERERQQHRRT
ncbi:MAG TPA: hypothetical protein VH599_00260 [Ktedonobacterales bacterium]|jgi:hypothetical protein